MMILIIIIRRLMLNIKIRIAIIFIIITAGGGRHGEVLHPPLGRPVECARGRVPRGFRV